MTPEAHIARLEAKNAALCEQVTALTGRIWGLEARLANDSSNSGTPPSSDGMMRKFTRLPWQSGKYCLGYAAAR